MEANLIILSKHTKKNTLDMGFKDSIKQSFRELYDEVTDKDIKVTPNKQTFVIRYKLFSKKSNMLFLKLSCDASDSKSAEAILYVISTFQKGPHRKDWNIVVTYDEASQYYCCKLMDGFGKFERKTRELVYTTLIKLFGVEWYSKSFQKELENQLKSKKLNPTDMIERALNELTYEELKSYLFEPYADWNLEDALNIQLSQERLASMEKDEIVEALNKCRAEKSLWDRFFSQYKEFNDFKTKIDELQKPRNSVMHHKQISKEQFDDYKKKLRAINNKLDHAIELLEDEIYSETSIADVAGALTKLTKFAMSDLVSGIESALSEFSRIAISAILPPDNISQMISNIADQFNTSYLLGTAVQDSMKSVLERYALLSENIRVSMPDLSYLEGIKKQLSNPVIDSAIRSAEIANRMARPYINIPDNISSLADDKEGDNEEPEDDENGDKKC